MLKLKRKFTFQELRDLLIKHHNKNIEILRIARPKPTLLSQSRQLERTRKKIITKSLIDLIGNTIWNLDIENLMILSLYMMQFMSQIMMFFNKHMALLMPQLIIVIITRTRFIHNKTIESTMTILLWNRHCKFLKESKLN